MHFLLPVMRKYCGHSWDSLSFSNASHFTFIVWRVNQSLNSIPRDRPTSNAPWRSYTNYAMPTTCGMWLLVAGKLKLSNDIAIMKVRNSCQLFIGCNSPQLNPAGDLVEQTTLSTANTFELQWKGSRNLMIILCTLSTVIWVSPEAPAILHLVWQPRI